MLRLDLSFTDRRSDLVDEGSIARCESAIQGRQREPCVPRPRPPALGVVRVARFLSFTDRRSDLVDEGIDRAVRIGDPGAAARALRAAASAAGARRRARRPLISRGAAGLGAVARARGVARARRAAGGLAIACRHTVFRNRV
ncbi:hypothetical protein AAFM48_32005 [Burkholderia pseudomallei]